MFDSKDSTSLRAPIGNRKNLEWDKLAQLSLAHIVNCQFVDDVIVKALVPSLYTFALKQIVLS